MRCPACKNDRSYRERRRGWLRALPWADAYRCSACASRYVVLWGRAVFRRRFLALAVFAAVVAILEGVLLGQRRLVQIMAWLYETLAIR